MSIAYNHYSSLPQFPEPYWRDSIDLPKFPSLEEDLQVDVVIVGGGITGITTAYLLSNEGMKVALLEAGNLLNGTTGHTTAKITAQHDLIYDELLNHFGHEKAYQYYEATSEALQFVKDTVQKHQIDCDLKEEDAYIYATQKSSINKMIKEIEAYEKLGIKGELINQLPIHLSVQSAIVMPHQAHFHPLKYLTHLVHLIQKQGVQIFERTTAMDVERGSTPTVITEKGNKVSGKYVVAATHFPFYDPSFYFARMHAERSYVLAIRPRKEFEGGMYLSVDQPVRSLRPLYIDGEDCLIIGGESHRTGQGICAFSHYEAIERFAQETYGIQEYKYRWSAQDLITLDKVPYIGQMNKEEPNIFVATGYRKWGMTNGTVAARLLSDLILERENPYVELYSPSRFNMDPSIKNFLKDNINVAGQLIAGKVGIVFDKVEDLSNDEATIVMIDGERCGAYKDLEGKLHIVDTTCTHLGCEVDWNHGDRTWDCPCHGSRYSITGEVIEGPAKEPLKQVKREVE